MAKKPIEVAALKHDAATRRNIPTAEFESVMRDEDKSPIQLAYERRNRDLDPQLVWRGKDEQDWSDLIVQAPPLYIQEKVHPKVIVDDLRRASQQRARDAADAVLDLFADFNGLPDLEAKTEFYQHDQHWSNRMILGDSLSVMASLAEREGLRGQVQCIYLDPPYGIKFNSNFQWSTTSRDVKDGAKDHVTREPEQVRAFRDTWRDGIHSYLTYLRDRLTVARDLLHESGSIFVQIGDENVHRVRALMDEVFGEDNFCSSIFFQKTTSTSSGILPNVGDHILWYSKAKSTAKFRPLLRPISGSGEAPKEFSLAMDDQGRIVPRRKAEEIGLKDFRLLRTNTAVSPEESKNLTCEIEFLNGVRLFCGSGRHWKTGNVGLRRLEKAARLDFTQGVTRLYRRFLSDNEYVEVPNVWTDTRSEQKQIYVVQTQAEVVKRCILMTTDPGDLVLDPTCGSGTTAAVAEQWGRRWITVDTSRVALALARSRLMGARYPYYLLADSPEGQAKEAAVTRSAPSTAATRGDIRHGFVYERVPHTTLKSIANNAEIDVIWEKWEETLAPLRRELSAAVATQKPSLRAAPSDPSLRGEAEATQGPTAPKPGSAAPGLLRRSAPRNDGNEGSNDREEGSGEAACTVLEEWEIPRERPDHWPPATEPLLHQFWDARIARQKEIDASIAAKADHEYLYDRPYADTARVRVAGPFTVESLSPHRMLAVDQDDELIDGLAETGPGYRHHGATPERDFAGMILENLRTAGVQQAQRADRITFTALTGWPGRLICAEGAFMEGDRQKRAGIFIGPEFGTVSRPDLVAAAREAGDAGFDMLIACAFNYDAHSAEFDKLGRVPVLKARMNPDLHMGGDLKPTNVGNLFVVFGEPDIQIEDVGDGMIRVKVFGVDVFKPQTGEVVSEGTDGIALWMLDTDYNEESFFVRHAYFLGANDPYKALKTTLKAEIDQDAWESLYSDTSRPFPKPKSGRIAVKVINHLGDEVMKVFGV